MAALFPIALIGFIVGWALKKATETESGTYDDVLSDSLRLRGSTDVGDLMEAAARAEAAGYPKVGAAYRLRVAAIRAGKAPTAEVDRRESARLIAEGVRAGNPEAVVAYQSIADRARGGDREAAAAKAAVDRASQEAQKRESAKKVVAAAADPAHPEHAQAVAAVTAIDQGAKAGHPPSVAAKETLLDAAKELKKAPPRPAPAPQYPTMPAFPQEPWPAAPAPAPAPTPAPTSPAPGARERDALLAEARGITSNPTPDGLNRLLDISVRLEALGYSAEARAVSATIDKLQAGAAPAPAPAAQAVPPITPRAARELVRAATNPQGKDHAAEEQIASIDRAAAAGVPGAAEAARTLVEAAKAVAKEDVAAGPVPATRAGAIREKNALLAEAKKIQDAPTPDGLNRMLEISVRLGVLGFPEDGKAVSALVDWLSPGVQPAPATTPVAGSPIPEATPEQWREFASRMMVAAPNAVSADNRLGKYGVGMRRLVDFGLARDPRQVGPRHVWVADWVPPYSAGVFLGSENLQDQVFARDMLDKRNLALQRFPSAIGSSIDGESCTLSGVLAAATRASAVPSARHGGGSALEQWLSSPDERKKFEATTAAFKRGNGVF